MKPVIGIGSDIGAAARDPRDCAFQFATYVDAVRKAGAIPMVIPPQPENAAEVVERLDGIVLAGGNDCDPAVYGEARHATVEPMDPRRQENDLSLARAAHDLGIPTLGICLGVQVMNVAAGGKLIQDIDSEMVTDIRHEGVPGNRSRHDVRIEPGTRLASILGARSWNVNSSHHQAIRTAAPGFRVTAHADDGVIEGLEDPRHPFYVGVQWHPEDMPGEESATTLFRAFVEAARKHAEERRREAVQEP